MKYLKYVKSVPFDAKKRTLTKKNEDSGIFTHDFVLRPFGVNSGNDTLWRRIALTGNERLVGYQCSGPKWNRWKSV